MLALEMTAQLQCCRVVDVMVQERHQLLYQPAFTSAVHANCYSCKLLFMCACFMFEVAIDTAEDTTQRVKD